jgi:hypothetical protein
MGRGGAPGVGRGSACRGCTAVAALRMWPHSHAGRGRAPGVEHGAARRGCATGACPSHAAPFMRPVHAWAAPGVGHRGARRVCHCVLCPALQSHWCGPFMCGQGWVGAGLHAGGAPLWPALRMQPCSHGPFTCGQGLGAGQHTGGVPPCLVASPSRATIGGGCCSPVTRSSDVHITLQAGGRGYHLRIPLLPPILAAPPHHLPLPVRATRGGVERERGGVPAEGNCMATEACAVLLIRGSPVAGWGMPFPNPCPPLHSTSAHMRVGEEQERGVGGLGCAPRECTLPSENRRGDTTSRWCPPSCSRSHCVPPPLRVHPSQSVPPMHAPVASHTGCAGKPRGEGEEGRCSRARELHCNRCTCDPPYPWGSHLQGGRGGEGPCHGCTSFRV